MSNKNLKQELYLQKALKSKDIELSEVLKLSNEEIEKLEISTKLKSFIYEMKVDGMNTVHTESEIKTELANIKISTDKVETSENIKELTDRYNDVPEDVKAQIQKEQEDKIKENDLELVMKKQAPADIVQMIKDVVSEGTSKSSAHYAKLIRTNISEAMLKEVDGTVINTIILEHINQIRAAEKAEKDSQKD